MQIGLNPPASCLLLVKACARFTFRSRLYLGTDYDGAVIFELFLLIVHALRISKRHTVVRLHEEVVWSEANGDSSWPILVCSAVFMPLLVSCIRFKAFLKNCQMSTSVTQLKNPIFAFQWKQFPILLRERLVVIEHPKSFFTHVTKDFHSVQRIISFH